MKRAHFLLLLIGALVAACTAPASERVTAEILNPVVASAWRNAGATKRQARSALRFASGFVAHDCEDYLAQRKHSVVDEGVNNRAALQEYLVCDTLELLAAADQVVDQPSSNNLGEQLRTRLDLTSFPSSLHQLAQEHPRLAELEAMAVRADARAVIAESDDWRFQLEVVAVTDINRNGHPDWIVWLTDTALDGNYRDYAVLVIPDVTEGGRLQAESVATTGPEGATLR